MKPITTHDPIAQRAVDLIFRIGPDVRDLLFERSRERIIGVRHTDAAHDAGEPRSVITDVDILVHAAVVSEFKHDPVYIVAEENKRGEATGSPDCPYRIVLDDLDGTYNASRGVLGRSAISLAIDKGAAPYAGIWYNPYFGEMIVAELWHGATYIFGDQQSQSAIPIAKPVFTENLSKARIHIGSTGATKDLRAKIGHKPLLTLSGVVLSALNIEATVPSLMDVALGRVEGFVIAANKAWDLWSARPIFNELEIPYQFFTPCWEKRLREEDIAGFDPDDHAFGFACAANSKLLDRIIAILMQ
jgi:fructose-1,6-bisphosphatase/inositol monophosphatase family enzyme